MRFINLIDRELRRAIAPGQSGANNTYTSVPSPNLINNNIVSFEAREGAVLRFSTRDCLTFIRTCAPKPNPNLSIASCRLELFQTLSQLRNLSQFDGFPSHYAISDKVRLMLPMIVRMRCSSASMLSMISKGVR